MVWGEELLLSGCGGISVVVVLVSSCTVVLFCSLVGVQAVGCVEEEVRGARRRTCGVSVCGGVEEGEGAAWSGRGFRGGGRAAWFACVCGAGREGRGRAQPGAWWWDAAPPSEVVVGC